MRRKFLVALVTVLSLTLSGCGWWKAAVAVGTGWSRICIDGVSYIQFASGATVEYLPDGKVKTCQ